MKTGGCQCGAVRFAIDDELGRASLCHCRMCQKAFGSFCGPLVSAHGLRWTRDGPKYFRSSNLVQRGFCEHCGTPLTFEPDAGVANVAIGALDDPNVAVPVIQLAMSERLTWFADLASLPGEATQKREETEAYYARIVSFQRPTTTQPSGQGAGLEQDSPCRAAADIAHLIWNQRLNVRQ